MGKKPTSTQEQLPSRWDELSGMEDVEERLDLARHQFNECDDRLLELRQQLDSEKSDGEIDDLARRSLAGESGVALLPDVQKIEQEIRECEVQEKVLHRAVKIVEAERSEARQKAVEELEPKVRERYQQIVEDTAKTLLTLEKLVVAEYEIRNLYNDHTGPKYFPVKVRPQNLRFDRERVHHWLEEATEHGFLDPSYLETFDAKRQEAPNPY